MTSPDRLGPLIAALSRAGLPTSDYDLNPGTTLPEGRVLRPAGVLVALRPGTGGVDVILTKRSSRLKHHPGQIAFAGGKVDAGDADVVAAALREAEEEIGLPRATVEVLGTAEAHETVPGFTVTPVLGFVRGEFTPRPEAGEVEEVFTVPLSHLLMSDRFAIERRR